MENQNKPLLIRPSRTPQRIPKMNFCPKSAAAQLTENIISRRIRLLQVVSQVPLQNMALYSYTELGVITIKTGSLPDKWPVHTWEIPPGNEGATSQKIQQKTSNSKCETVQSMSLLLFDRSTNFVKESYFGWSRILSYLTLTFLFLFCKYSWSELQ